MELNRTKPWFYGLTLLWVFMLLGLGSWWLYLVFKLHTTLNELNLPQLGSPAKFLNMMKWEGSFFFIFLILLGASLFYMYFRDMRKTKAMQAFLSKDSAATCPDDLIAQDAYNAADAMLEARK